MTAEATKVAAAVDKLVALFDAATTTTVYDGPKVTFPEASWIVVGSDGVIQEEEDAAASSQVWKGLGANIRDEEIRVTCACGYSTGADATAKSARDGAEAIFSACVAALRSDPGLMLGTGIPFVTGGAAAVTDNALRYVTNSGGIAAVYVFTITIPVRLQP
jgi:hypothetical protein